MTWSCEDLKCCFYMFGFPEEWWSHFVLNWSFKGSDFGADHDEEVGLGLCVMPMGYKNAMTLVQYWHRKMIAAVSKPSASLPLHREVHKDRAIPAWRCDGGEWSRFWLIYCDDYDQRQLYETAEQAEQHLEEVSVWQKGSGRCL